MPTKSIRDLVENWNPPADPTLRDVAADRITESTSYEELPGWCSRSPGDEEPHPFGNAVSNPMPELGGAQALSRALHAGKIPFDKERQVRKYLGQFVAFEEQAIHDPRNHRAVDDEPQEPRVYGDSTWLRTHR